MGAEQPPAGKQGPAGNGQKTAMHLHVMRVGKRVGIAIAGGLVIILGIVLSVPLVPGPGLAIVLLGVAILSLEFERPRLWLAALKVRARALRFRLRAWLVPARDRARRFKLWFRRPRSRSGDG